jgi:hypothetical protein
MPLERWKLAGEKQKDIIILYDLFVDISILGMWQYKKRGR